MSKKVQDIMTRGVETAGPEDSLQEAARKMRLQDIGFLPVCDGERLIGTLTDRDITIKGTAEGKDPKKTRVKDVAEKDVVWCYADDDVDDAAKKMQHEKVRRIMVIDRDSRRLVGVASVGDLATRASSKDSGNVMDKTGPR